MRNGIYRVWYSGSIQGTAAMMLNDGDLVACECTHSFVGRYTEMNGRFNARMTGTRHTIMADAHTVRQLETIEIALEGNCTDEIAILKGTAPELPGFAMELRFVWLCES